LFGIGETGLLVDEFDYLRMAEEIGFLFREPDRMKKMSPAASKGIRVNEQVAGHIQILSEILDRYKVKA